ncbi:MAG TPA: hypothetical protein C5S37_10115 [Methanophagales archaeon]|nr:hypothetical protein [Methanophagales archaeon]
MFTAEIAESAEMTKKMIFLTLCVLYGLSGKKVLKKMKNKNNLKFLLLPVTLLLLILVIHNIGFSNLYSTLSF